MRIFTAGLRVQEIVVKGGDYVRGTQNIGRRDKAVPFSSAVGVYESQPREATAAKPILMGGVWLEPADPEDLNLFPLDPIGDWFRSPVVDRDRKYINDSAVSIRMDAIPFRGDNHDVGPCAEVDDVRTSLEVVCRVVDAQCLVDRDLASLLDVGVKNIFSCKFFAPIKQS